MKAQEGCMPFYYCPRSLFLKWFPLQELETSYEEKKGQNDGVGPLKARTTKEEPINLKRGKNSSQKEADGMTYVSK